MTDISRTVIHEFIRIVRTCSRFAGSKLIPDFDALPLRVRELRYKSQLWSWEALFDVIGWDIKKAVMKSLPGVSVRLCRRQRIVTQTQCPCNPPPS